MLLTQTKGTLVFNSQMIGYQPLGRDLPKLRLGTLIASQSGEALSYGLEAAQGRGNTFVGPGTQVYEGMIVGQNTKDADIEINVCKGKKLTNMRSSGADFLIQLAPPIVLSLEQSLDFLENDELLEITPDNLRLRKRYLTDIERRRQRR
jgi:GTP-binding protein